MNKLIKDQLSKVKIADLKYDESTTEIHIPKTVEIKADKLEVGKVYKLRLSEKATNPQSDSTFSANWNGGRVPKNTEYVAEIVDKVASYVKLNGIATNDSFDNWFGWVSENDIKVLEKR